MPGTLDFKFFLGRLEEAHDTEISQLRQEYEDLLEKSQKKHAELGQLLLNARQTCMDLESEVVMMRTVSPCTESSATSASGKGLADSSSQLSDGSMINQPDSWPDAITKMQEDNRILHQHVSSHLESKKGKRVTLLGSSSSVERYAMLRGWSIGKPAPERSKMGVLVNHQVFDASCALAIILNTAFLGVLTTYRAETLGKEQLPVSYKVTNKLFTCWFLIELALRWTADGLCIFLSRSPNVRWNLFDVFVVGTDVFELVVEYATDSETAAFENLTIMRMLRVMRMARALRVVRLVGFCKELRMMVLSILKSGMALLWSMVLLGIIIYIFGIFLMQSTTEHLANYNSRMAQSSDIQSYAKDSIEAKLLGYFGTINMTFYTLFKAVSGGISWGEIGDPLSEASWINGFVFCFYVFFTVIAMLNIITGIFVQTAISSVMNDSDEVIQEEMQAENSMIKQLHGVFEAMDEDGTGRITVKQFESLVEEQRTHALLGGLGLQVSEARGLFSLLDLENTGYVTIDDFLVGCMRLRGGAREVDLISLMYESRNMMAQWEKLADFLKTEFQRMDTFEDRVDTILNSEGKMQPSQQQSQPESQPQSRRHSQNHLLHLPSDTLEDEVGQYGEKHGVGNVTAI